MRLGDLPDHDVVVALLDDLFTRLDADTAEWRLEKIKTVGDAVQKVDAVAAAKEG